MYMSTMHHSPAVFVLLLMATAAATSSSFFLVADARQLERADAAGGSCIGSERDVLLAFKQGISDTYGQLRSWQQGRQDCCQWVGVGCSNATGHVIRLDVGYTNLAGQISPSLLSLEYLEYLDLRNTHLSGPNGGVPEFLGAFKNLRHLDLSLNQLVGGIPDGVTSLSGLLNLKLSWNQLSGKIPASIGAMKSIESLELSRNNLSGEIPSSLSNLMYLSSLDLSYNNFEGRIPHGSQLDTLYMENPSIYAGNIGLCGPPLEWNCSTDTTPEHDNQQRREKVSEPVLFFYFGLGTGFLVGLWIVYCALLFKKAWRIAYFRLFDRLYDNAYVFVVVTWGSINCKATS